MSEEIIYIRSDPNDDEEATSFETNDNESSKLLSALLGSDNITNEELNIYRQWAICFEHTVKQVHQNNYCFILTGSSIDCSFSSGSDFDQMIEVNDTEVTKLGDTDDRQMGNMLIMSQENCTPGFTILSVYTLSQNPHTPETIACIESCVQTKGRTLLSNDKYIEYQMKVISGRNMNSPPSFHAGEAMRDGSCVMLNYSYNGQDSEIGIGLRCSSWPKEANEWITRKRESNWPNQALNHKIKTMPCHVLPVGNPNSKNCQLEWRFAFVLPERELIWNFSDVQIQCYVILKTLKKEILDKMFEKELNSFHLKTVVFWKSEEISQWNGSNLIENVQKCLLFLNECIQQRHLSHYFIKSRNLFAGKLLDESKRSRLSCEIGRLHVNVLEYFLNCEWRY